MVERGVAPVASKVGDEVTRGGLDQNKIFLTCHGGAAPTGDRRGRSASFRSILIRLGGILLFVTDASQMLSQIEQSVAAR